MCLVAVNVVASRPPERRPTEAPNTHANVWSKKVCTKNYFSKFKVLIRKNLPKNFTGKNT